VFSSLLGRRARNSGHARAERYYVRMGRYSSHVQWKHYCGITANLSISIPTIPSPSTRFPHLTPPPAITCNGSERCEECTKCGYGSRLWSRNRGKYEGKHSGSMADVVGPGGRQGVSVNVNCLGICVPCLRSVAQISATRFVGERSKCLYGLSTHARYRN